MRFSVEPRLLIAAGAGGVSAWWLWRCWRKRFRSLLSQTHGTVSSIWTCAVTSHPMEKRTEITCVAGKGILGDRYNMNELKGRYSDNTEPGRQFTIIAAEGMERLREIHGLDIGPSNSRRNVVTRGIDISKKLVGHRIKLGEVVVFAHRRCVPCMYLEGLLKQKGLMEEMYYDAGLSCEVLQGGKIVEGQAVEVVPGSYEPSKCVTWPGTGVWVRPRERNAAERAEVLADQAGMIQEIARLESEKPNSTELAKAKKGLRLFNQAMGAKDSNWDGGSPQW